MKNAFFVNQLLNRKPLVVNFDNLSGELFFFVFVLNLLEQRVELLVLILKVIFYVVKFFGSLAQKMQYDRISYVVNHNLLRLLPCVHHLNDVVLAVQIKCASVTCSSNPPSSLKSVWVLNESSAYFVVVKLVIVDYFYLLSVVDNVFKSWNCDTRLCNVRWNDNDVRVLVNISFCRFKVFIVC